ncbi:MAG: energy transducer TonB [Bacteroidota bacterium]
MKPALSYKCNLRWDDFSIGLEKRHCSQCNKHIHDFTSWTKEDLIKFLLRNQDQSICGRLLPSQVSYSLIGEINVIDTLYIENRNSSLAFLFLTIGTLLLAGCENGNEKNAIFASEINIYPEHPKKNDSNTDQNDKTSESDSTNYKKQDVISMHHTIGVVSAIPEPDIDDDGVYVNPHYMAEFEGGVDKMNDYLRQNINYPQWEKDNNIQGKVMVSFIVDENGKVQNPKILKSVYGSKNFDTEVLRVINSMPDWTPAIHDGKNVKVRYALPVNFKVGK